MKQHEKKMLRVVTNETREATAAADVVTPSIYAGIFMQRAKAHDICLDQEDQLVSRLLDEKIDFYETLQQKTQNGANRLTRSADKALLAIQDKDDASLQAVAKETKNLKNELDKLKKSLYSDELTGVYNRKWLRNEVLEEGSNTLNQSGILAMIDLNYFKMINDTYGHIIGDKVLLFIAKQLGKTEADVVRYGGDEFMLFFSAELSLHHVTQTLHGIREEIAQKRLKAKTDLFRVSFSFGSVSFKQGEDLEDVIQQADAVMYEDKAAIKKRITGIYF